MVRCLENGIIPKVYEGIIEKIEIEDKKVLVTDPNVKITKWLAAKGIKSDVKPVRRKGILQKTVIIILRPNREKRGQRMICLFRRQIIFSCIQTFSMTWSNNSIPPDWYAALILLSL